MSGNGFWLIFAWILIKCLRFWQISKFCIFQFFGWQNWKHSEAQNLDENNESGYSKEFYSASDDLRKQYSADQEVKKIIDIALGLEGLRRQDGIHAAAIVISPDKITNFLRPWLKIEAFKTFHWSKFQK